MSRRQSAPHTHTHTKRYQNLNHSPGASVTKWNKSSGLNEIWELLSVSSQTHKQKHIPHNLSTDRYSFIGKRLSNILMEKAEHIQEPRLSLSESYIYFNYNNNLENQKVHEKWLSQFCQIYTLIQTLRGWGFATVKVIDINHLYRSHSLIIVFKCSCLCLQDSDLVRNSEQVHTHINFCTMLKINYW